MLMEKRGQEEVVRGVRKGLYRRLDQGCEVKMAGMRQLTFCGEFVSEGDLRAMTV